MQPSQISSCGAERPIIYININLYTFLYFLHARGKVGLLEEMYILNSSVMEDKTNSSRDDKYGMKT